MVWYLGEGGVTKGSDHMERRSPCIRHSLYYNYFKLSLYLHPGHGKERQECEGHEVQESRLRSFEDLKQNYP